MSADGDANVALLERMYSAFNARELEAALAGMQPDVSWPDVARGAVLVGRDAVRAYWQAQLRAGDPKVFPVKFSSTRDRVVVEVSQQLRDLDGKVVEAGHVVHQYLFRDGLVAKMMVLPKP